MLKRAYHVQLTYQISDTEKMYAEQAIEAFNFLINASDRFVEHLDKMMVPFKNNLDIPPEQIWEARLTFTKYKEEAESNLQRLKKLAFNCVKIMMNFSSDTQVKKLMKSFNMAIDDVSKQFERFCALFKNLQDKDFIRNSVAGISAIKKEIAQFKQIIEERIQKYIETDILAKSWVDHIDDTEISLETKVPFEKQLLDAQKIKIKDK